MQSNAAKKKITLRKTFRSYNTYLLRTWSREVTLMECPLRTQFCAPFFTCILSNFIWITKHSVCQVLLRSLFYKEGNWGFQWLTNLPKRYVANYVAARGLKHLTRCTVDKPHASDDSTTWPMPTSLHKRVAVSEAQIMKTRECVLWWRCEDRFLGCKEWRSTWLGRSKHRLTRKEELCLKNGEN